MAFFYLTIIKKIRTLINMKNLIEIKTDDDFIIDLMYAGTENMMQTNVYERVGLGNRCFVQQDMFIKLEALRPKLREKGLKLKIKDAYRPPLAHEMMLKIIPMEGFFARTPERSQHCHGSAIDCVLCTREGTELKFPCQVDAYEKKYAEQIARGEWAEFQQHLKKASYNWQNSTMEELANRGLQKELMESVGFKSLEHEWWHFNLPDKDKYPMVEFRINHNQIEFY